MGSLTPDVGNMRDFIRRLENEGDLVRIKKEVSGGDESASVLWELEDRKGNNGPAVVFEKIKGHDIPVVKNLFGSLRRWALILGFPSWRDIKIKELKEYLLQKIETEKGWIPPEMMHAKGAAIQTTLDNS